MISRHLRRLACIMTAESSKKRLLNRVRSKKGALKQIAECGYIDGGWYGNQILKVQMSIIARPLCREGRLWFDCMRSR